MADCKIQWIWSDPRVDQNHIFILSVDGVHTKTFENRKNPTAAIYSHKSNGPGLAYEIGVALYYDKIVWVNGPFPAGTSDLSIFRAPNGLKSRIPAGKRIIGDNGYKGEANIISTSNPLDSEAVRAFKRRARARHETINARIKKYSIVSGCFRHPKNKHKMVFDSVCILVQYDMEHGHGLLEM